MQINLDQKIYNEIIGIFHEASIIDLNNFINDNDIGENTLTDNLYGEIKKRIPIDFTNSNNNKKLNFKFTRKLEKTVGADLVVRVIADWGFLKFDRFIFIECKKQLDENSKEYYRDLHTDNGPKKHLIDQITRMQIYTKNFSYVMFYTNKTGANFIFDFPMNFYRDDKFSILLHRLAKDNIFYKNYYYPCCLVPARNLISPKGKFDLESIQLQSEYFPTLIVDQLFKGLIGEDWNDDINKLFESKEDTQFWTINIEKTNVN